MGRVDDTGGAAVPRVAVDEDRPDPTVRLDVLSVRGDRAAHAEHQGHEQHDEHRTPTARRGAHAAGYRSPHLTVTETVTVCCPGSIGTVDAWAVRSAERGWSCPVTFSCTDKTRDREVPASFAY